MLFGCEVLCALSYIFMDKLDALGLVNGTDAHGARRIMLPTMVVFDIIVVAGIIWMAGGV